MLQTIPVLKGFRTGFDRRVTELFCFSRPLLYLALTLALALSRIAIYNPAKNRSQPYD